MPHVQPPSGPAPMSHEKMQQRYGAATSQVVAFYHQLTRLSLQTWIDVASADPGARRSAAAELEPADADPEQTADAAARIRLREVMDTMAGATTRVRRRIHDITSSAAGFAHQADVARMNRVALTAALALVARPQLDDADFARLYGPFATLIPVDELSPEP